MSTPTTSEILQALWDEAEHNLAAMSPAERAEMARRDDDALEAAEGPDCVRPFPSDWRAE